MRERAKWVALINLQRCQLQKTTTMSFIYPTNAISKHHSKKTTIEARTICALAELHKQPHRDQQPSTDPEIKFDLRKSFVKADYFLSVSKFSVPNICIQARSTLN
jgi:hypothetical protein